jgi:hypothetical protein
VSSRQLGSVRWDTRCKGDGRRLTLRWAEGLGVGNHGRVPYLLEECIRVPKAGKAIH